MRVNEAKELFRSLTKAFFANATVTFSRQSRVAKPTLPLVTITPGNVHRDMHPVYTLIDGVQVGHYASRISMTVDLFTHGLPVYDPETNEPGAYENTAVDDMLVFADFLGSQYTVEWCHSHDVSLHIEGEVQDLTGVVNDNNYEFRSRVEVMFYFTQKAIGHTGVLGEDSLRYPTGIIGPDGEPIYTTVKPVPTDSVTPDLEQDPGAIIDPVFTQTSSGGGTEELAAMDTGYFTKAEIKEETGNE